MGQFTTRAIAAAACCAEIISSFIALGSERPIDWLCGRSHLASQPKERIVRRTRSARRGGAYSLSSDKRTRQSVITSARSSL